jgi:Subtilase family/S-layer homology domain
MQRNGGDRGLALSALVVLILGGLLPTASVHAADPLRGAQEQLASELGGAPTDFELIYEAPTGETATGAASWAAKLVDRRTGEIHPVYQLTDGHIGGLAALDEAVGVARAASSALDLKADAPLLAAVSSGEPGKLLPVAVWLEVDTTAAETAVRDAHPEVTWLGERPLAGSLEQARAIRGDLWYARQGAYAAAAEWLRGEVEAAGGSVAYVSTSAPLVFVDLPSAAVESVAVLEGVQSLGLEEEWRTSMSSAGPTVSADWIGGGADQGSGVRVAVVEYHNVSATGDLAWTVVATGSTTGATPTHSHPTWVAGAIASQNGTFAGVAPGAGIVTSSTGGYSPGLTNDRAIIAAADWAVAPDGGDADIVNASIGQDTATGAEEARRYFDSIGWEDGRLVVAAAGNLTTFGNWDVVSPGTGYNVLTVGGVNDRNSGGRGDDVVWYVPGSNGSNYHDRTDASWNPHGDFNKPNLSAPAVSVRTANGITGDGTSVASPIVAGIAAQLIARAPSLASVPEATRAIMMAGALQRTPMPDGSINADHEGVGTASALWANRVLTAGPYGGYAIGAMHPGETAVHNVQVVAGQLVRVALAWSSHTSGGSNLGKADVLASDLDLRVVAPNGAVVGSYTFDNPYEVVDLVAPSNGTMRIEVRHARMETSAEPYGLAWALTFPFADAESSQFISDILWIAQRGITLGCGGGSYCPLSPVTREEMASFLVRAMGLPATGNDYFDDDAGSMHEGPINALAAAGVTQGCGQRQYCPSQGVSREEMASFLVRALGLGWTPADHFDDDAGSIHEGPINSLASAGITTGCGAPRSFCPTNGVTREQMAGFLHRAFQ